ncbi:unnamed protein product [Dicrocoelium dendriticum]|nr:unnamed protein product [Dicrocoelium dendriticum]
MKDSDISVIHKGRFCLIQLIRGDALGCPKIVKWIPCEEPSKCYPPARTEQHSSLSAGTSSQLPQNKLPTECRINQKLQHENIVKFIGLLRDVNAIGIVMEYLERGSLASAPITMTFAHDQIWAYLEGMMSGLSYMHNNNIVHRDINPNNLLLTDDDQIKISDFGLSEEVQEDTELTGTIGTPQYLAPECVQEPSKPYKGKPVDVWASGMTLYWMIYRQVTICKV